MPATQDAPLRLPPALRKRRSAADQRAIKRLMRQGSLTTVCEEARCPNIGECFSSGTATFMIMGDTCTRACHFCSVKTGRPASLAADEPDQLAAAAVEMGLEHVVITSVDRDELPDLGAAHFARCIRAVKRALPDAEVEVLTPDFKGREELVDVVLDAGPHVFNHNIETVARLYNDVRPQSRFETTTGLLRYVAASGHPAVKSGMMVGLGERDSEVLETLELLADIGVHIATIGQYMRPTLKQWPVERYVDDATYARFRDHGHASGISHVFAGPFVRSSYQAREAAAAHRVRQSSALKVLQ